ncbi:hypothetical protein ACGF5M_06305 [Gemmatimonadota bacterium]
MWIFQGPHGRHARIWAAYAAIYLIWGSTFLAIRFALDTVPPFLGAGILSYQEKTK